VLAVVCLWAWVGGPIAARGGDEISNAAIDSAILRGLEYLSSVQQPSGAWETDSFGESTASTSLAVMAFLAAGHVPSEGPYGQQITRGIRWVLDHQEDNGMIVHRKSHGPMYSHGISTLMLAEVIGMVEAKDEPKVRRALERAVALILKSQAVSKHSRHAGGWRYQVDSKDSDLSVSGWQVLALRAAKNCGCDVPAEAIDDAIAYVKLCAARDHRGFGYQPGNGATPTLSGVGILALEVCGDHHSPEALGAAEYLLERPLRPGSNYFYYGVYYTNVGMFKVGGKYAEATREHTADMLVRFQQPDGSWLSEHSTERRVGPIYSTGLALLALAVDYRYLPIYQR
jgi:squalene cyclase